MSVSVVERIARMEVEVAQLKLTANAIDEKLDELLALRNKGVGVFWLMSVVCGTSLIGALNLLMNWIKS